MKKMLLLLVLLVGVLALPADAQVCMGGAPGCPSGGGSSSFAASTASPATYCADAGATDDYACSLTPAPASYAAIIGVPLTFKANTVNTGAATISFNSLGAQAIVNVGATTTTALVTNDIRAGSVVTVVWDGTSFECLSCGGNGANLAIAQTWSAAQTFTGSATVPSGSSQITLGSNLAFIYGGLTAQTPDTSGLLLNTTSNSFKVFAFGNIGTDFQNLCITGLGTASCTDASWIVQSNDTTPAHGIAIGHNRTNAVVYSGAGPVALGGVSSAVASASAMPLPTGNIFHVTGTTNITSITATGLSAGITITIIFDGVLTFTDGNNLKLAGNFVTTADDTITLAYDGTNFYEVARAVN